MSAPKVDRKTHEIDATGQVLGRLATQVAIFLRGKHKPTYVPQWDVGDYVVIHNVDKIRVTGKKMTDKIYRHHTQYLGGVKEETLTHLIDRKGMSEILYRAVLRMMPRNRLRVDMMKRLKFFAKGGSVSGGE